MPNQPRAGTSHRGFRLDDTLWARFVAKAQSHGQTAAERIRQLITADVEDDDTDG